MRRATLIATATAAATIAVACPRGHRVRILAVMATITAGLTTQVACQFTSQSQTVYTTATNVFTNQGTLASFAIGHALTTTTEAVVDPATGVVTLDNTPTVWTAPLVDAWWDKDVSVFCSGTPTAITVVYELDDVP